MRSLVMLFWFAVAMVAVSSAFSKETFQDDREETRAIVEAAYDYIKAHSNDMTDVQEALLTHPNLSNKKKDLYVFLHCYNIEEKKAVCCGQGSRPELVGKNMWHLRTPTGRLVFHEIARMIEKDGKGWIEYDWLNPYTKTIQTKISYVKGISLGDRGKAWVGCGFWKKK